MLQSFSVTGSGLVSSSAEGPRVSIYTNPDAAEKQRLVATLGIDEHTLSSALDPDEVSRVEFKPDHVFLIWKRPNNASVEEQILFGVSSIGAFLYENEFVVVVTDAMVFPGEKQVRRPADLLDVLLNLLYETVHHYLGHLKVIKQLQRDVQKKINTAMENEYLIQMFSLGESLTYYLSAISSNNIMLARLRTNAEKLALSPAQVEYLDDIVIESNQCYRQAEIYSSILSGLMDARGTLVNNNMNVLMKNLTMINVVFLPLNLIASIGGMSEYSVMTQGMNIYLSFGIFTLSMVVIGWLTTLFLRRGTRFRSTPDHS
jgi:magnesium transporter